MKVEIIGQFSVENLPSMQRNKNKNKRKIHTQQNKAIKITKKQDKKPRQDVNTTPV